MVAAWAALSVAIRRLAGLDAGLAGVPCMSVAGKMGGRDMVDVDRGKLAGAGQAGPEAFWPYRWWRIVDFKIGIVPLPIYLALLALITGFVLAGKVPSDILMGIVLLSIGGFTCAEL